MNSYVGLGGLVVLFGLIFAWGIYSRGLRKRFLRDLELRGFGNGAVLPEALRVKYPYLQGRAGPGGVLFLLGAKLGGFVSLPSGGGTQALQLFLGFVVPAGRTAVKADEPTLRRLIGEPLVCETLADGAQMFLWARPHRPGQLAKTLKALQVVMERAVPLKAAEPPTPEIAQATTPRPDVAPSPTKRFCARVNYWSDEPRLSASVNGFVERAEAPAREEWYELFKKDAMALMIRYGHLKVGPLRGDGMSLEELPLSPIPPAEDRRSLKHWKISATVSSDDLRFDKQVSLVFGWPESPPQEVIAQMENLLAMDAVAMNGSGLSYAEVATVNDVKIEPTMEALSYMAR